MDVGTYFTQVFWLVVVFSMLYIIVIREGGIIEKISGILKVRRKRSMGEVVVESGVEEGGEEAKKVLEIMKMH